MREISLVSIIVLSALLFGAVEVWSLALVGLLVAAVFSITVSRLRSLELASFERRAMVLSMGAAVVYAALQIVPLPLSFLRFLQPGLAEVVTIVPQGPPQYHSISIYPFATEIGLGKVILYFMVFLTAQYGIGGRERLIWTLKALAVFGFVLALFGIIQKATWNGKLYWVRELTQGGTPFGPFVNRNHFAGFIGMIIPLSLGAAFMSRSVEKRVLYAFFSVTMTVALFLSLSRGGIISFLVGVAVFSSVVFAKSYTKRKLVPIFLFLVVVAVYLLSLGISPVIERFARTDVTQEDRLLAWQGTIAAFREFPVFGSGLGTFQHVFKLYQPEGLYAYYDHAHNDYLEHLLETGVLGVLLTATFFVLVARAMFRMGDEGRAVYLKAGLLSSVTTMAVHSFFDFNIHIPSNAILFFAVLGMAVLAGHKDA